MTVCQETGAGDSQELSDRAEFIAVFTVEVLALGSLVRAAPPCLVCLVAVAKAGTAGDLRLPLDKKAADVPDPSFTDPLDPALGEESASPTVWGADSPLESRAISPLSWEARIPLELGLVRGCLGDLLVQLERDDDGANGARCAAPNGPTPATGATGAAESAESAESADANELIPAAPDL